MSFLGSVGGFLVRQKFGVAVGLAALLGAGLVRSEVNRIREDERQEVLAEMAENRLSAERRARVRADSVTASQRAVISALRVTNDSVVADSEARERAARAMVRPAEVLVANAGANLDATADSLGGVIAPEHQQLYNSLLIQIAEERNANRNLLQIERARGLAQAEQIIAQAATIAGQDELEQLRLTERAAMQAEMDAIAAAYQAALDRQDGPWYGGLATIGKGIALVGVGYAIHELTN